MTFAAVAAAVSLAANVVWLAVGVLALLILIDFIRTA